MSDLSKKVVTLELKVGEVNVILSQLSRACESIMEIIGSVKGQAEKQLSDEAKKMQGEKSLEEDASEAKTPDEVIQ